MAILPRSSKCIHHESHSYLRLWWLLEVEWIIERLRLAHWLGVTPIHYLRERLSSTLILQSKPQL
jgi:hypothetical protein